MKNEFDFDELREMVQDCNSWNGSFEDLEAWENDEEFFNVFFEGNPFEVTRATYYGDYRFADDYVRFNAYGNLKSFNEWEYEDELKERSQEIVERAYELIDNLYLSDELEEKIRNEFEEEEEEEDEEE